MCTCRSKMFSPLKFITFTLFIYFTVINAQRERKLCADQECKEPLSLARTLIKYVSSDRDVMSFNVNENVVVYSKYLGAKDQQWFVEIGGKRGNVPKRFVQENRILAKETVEVFEEETLASDKNKDDIPKGSLASENEIESKSATENSVNSSQEEQKIAESIILKNSQDASEGAVKHSTDSVPETLSPTSASEHGTKEEVKESVSLDNVVEYTDEKYYFTTDAAHSNAWFPETGTGDQSSMEIAQSIDSLGDASATLIPSITSAEKLDQEETMKYVAIDGTPIPDIDLGSNSELPEVGTTSTADESLIQPTSVSLDSNQKSSFDVEYSSSSVNSNLLETETTATGYVNEETGDSLNVQGETSLSSEKEVSTKDSELSPEAAKPDAVSGNWYSGITDFFVINENDSNVSQNNSESSATVVLDESSTTESIENKLTLLSEQTSSVHSLNEKQNDAVQNTPIIEGNLDEAEDKNDEESVDLVEDDEEDAEDDESEEPDEDDNKLENDGEISYAHNSINSKENATEDILLSENSLTNSLNNNLTEKSENEELKVADNLQEISSNESITDDTHSKIAYETDELSSQSESKFEGEIVTPSPTLEPTMENINAGQSQLEEDNNVGDVFGEYVGLSRDLPEDKIQQEKLAVNEEINESENIDSSKKDESEHTETGYTTESAAEEFLTALNSATESCDDSDNEFCEKNSEIKLEDAFIETERDSNVDESAGIVEQLKGFFDSAFLWLPDPILELLHELEALSISPKAVILTVIVGIFVFILEISFIAIKKRLKERMYLTKIGNLDQKLFTAVTERDDLKLEIMTLKQKTECSSVEYLDAQIVIDDLHRQLECSKNECAKLQVDNATLQEQLETATEVGLDLNQMLSEFLTSQNSNVKFQEAVTRLQEQLESQQTIITNLQLKAEVSDEDKLKHMEELESVRLEKASLEKLNEELTANYSELFSIRENLLENNSDKEQQIAILQQHNAQLLKESEEWNQSVQLLQQTNTTNHNKIEELTEALSKKTIELTAIKEFLSGLQFSKENDNAAENDNNSSNIVLNADKILEQISNVTIFKTELVVVKEERDKYQQQYLKEHEARVAVEESIHSMKSENICLKDEFAKANQEKVDAQTKLDVLSNYFKEKEMQLQKELGLQEAMRQQSQENATSVTHRIATFEQEAELNRSQLTSLKAEIESQEKSFRNQLLAQEKKAHENWLAARVAERKLEQMKQETALLRNKLTVLEQNEATKQTPQPSKTNSDSNCEAFSTQNTLVPEDRSASMDLPTSGRSSLFREPMDSEQRFPFLPLDRPLPPPPFIPPMPILPPPLPHLLPMGNHVPILPPPPHLLPPRRPILNHNSPMEHWMSDRTRHSFDHQSNRDRRTPPQMPNCQRSPPPYDDRPLPGRPGASHPSAVSDRREEMMNRDNYRAHTPPSRFTEQSVHHSNYIGDNTPPHLRRYKLDNGALDPKKPVISRNNDNLSSV